MKTEINPAGKERSRGSNPSVSFLTITVIACVLFGLTDPATAWDGERKGFIMGAAGGFGLVSITGETISGFPRPRTNSILLGTDVQIGTAPSNQIEYYLFGNASWFSTDGTFTLNQLTGVGLTYYPKQGFLPPVPSPFVSCGVGVSYLKPFDSGQAEQYGFGLTFGGGYEFKEHMRVQGSFVWSKPSTKIGGQRITVFPWTLKVLFSVLGY